MNFRGAEGGLRMARDEHVRAPVALRMGGDSPIPLIVDQGNHHLWER